MILKTLTPHLGNYLKGQGSDVLLEVDESDPEFTHFKPTLLGLTTLDKDHAPLDIQKDRLRTLMHQSKKLVYQEDQPHLKEICQEAETKCISVSRTNRKADYFYEPISHQLNKLEFKVNGVFGSLSLMGEFNLSNAALALALADQLGVPLNQSIKKMAQFKGIQYRFEVHQEGESYFILDFAHNPEKIGQSLITAQSLGHPVGFIFQPHGYGPLRFFLKELAETFNHGLREEDQLYLLKVFDAGGTASRTIQSEDLLKSIQHPQAYCFETREAFYSFIQGEKMGPKTWIVAGARDESLGEIRNHLIQFQKKRFL